MYRVLVPFPAFFPHIFARKLEKAREKKLHKVIALSFSKFQKFPKQHLKADIFHFPDQQTVEALNLEDKAIFNSNMDIVSY